MSWPDLIDNNKLSITTGDGEIYTPLWKNATKNSEFNTSLFNFVNKDGTYAYRGKRPGSAIPLELYFVGENCIEDSNNFDKSLDDSRALILEHPFFGFRRVQPVSMQMSDANLNTCQIILNVFETIESNQPETQEDKAEDILSIGGAIYTTLKAVYLKNPQDSSDVRNLKSSIDLFYNDFVSFISDSSERAGFDNLKNDALRKVENVFTDAGATIDALTAMVDYPFVVSHSVQDKLGIFQRSLSRFTNKVKNILGFNTSVYHSVYGSSILSAMCRTSVNPQANDYKTRSQVVEAISIISNTYYDFIAEVDRRTVDNAQVSGNFAPDSLMLDDLYKLVVKTTADLIDISQDSQIEREFAIQEDTDIIKLTHRFYGLDEDDNNIKSIVELNDFKGNDYIYLKKGRIIKYLR
jgi:hypothetical protein